MNYTTRRLIRELMELPVGPPMTKSILVYDRYDIWQLDPSGQSDPVCVTDSEGRDNMIRLRARQLDREAKIPGSGRHVFDCVQ